MNPFSITDTDSVMIKDFSFDRSHFYMAHSWTRSIVTAGITGAVVIFALFCALQLLRPEVLLALGAQAESFKIAFSALVIALLSFSLYVVFKSVTSDYMGCVRRERANEWLLSGTISHPSSETEFSMAACCLAMVRLVETDNGITIFALGSHDDFSQPFLIEANLEDYGSDTKAKIWASVADIRSHISRACGEWTQEAASVLDITINTPSSVFRHDHNDTDDMDGLDDLPPTGRASAPTNKTSIFQDAASIPDTARIN